MAFVSPLVWPLVGAVTVGVAVVSGTLYGLWHSGRADIEPGNIKRELGIDGAASVLFYFPQANLSQADMEILAAMTVEPSTEGKIGHHAIIRNEAANFSAEGVVTGLHANHSHGIQHGNLYVTLAEDKEPIEGKWLHVDKAAGEEKVAAFVKLQKTMSDLHGNHENLLDILEQVAKDEAVEA